MAEEAEDVVLVVAVVVVVFPGRVIFLVLVVDVLEVVAALKSSQN